jgi:hypothetical protein
MPLDHASVTTSPSRYDEVVAWYVAALAPLGYTKQLDYPGVACGLGDPKPDFWIGAKEGTAEVTQLHFAFTAKGMEICRSKVWN